MLDKVLDEAAIGGFDNAERAAMTLFWHRLDPWPDAAARKQGMRTGFIHRPREWGEGTTPVQTPDPATDIIAGDLDELAGLLGA